MPSREHMLGVANTAHLLEDMSLSGRPGVGLPGRWASGCVSLSGAELSPHSFSVLFLVMGTVNDL